MFTLDLKTSCLRTLECEIEVDSDDGVVDTCPVGGDGDVSPSVVSDEVETYSESEPFAHSSNIKCVCGYVWMNYSKNINIR